MAREAKVGRDSHRLSIRAVLGRDRARVEVGEPDHNFIDIGTTGGVGGEKVVSNVSDDRA